MKKLFTLLIIIIISMIFFVSKSEAQVELVQPNHPVYDFLQRMQTLKIIFDYNKANIPISRENVAVYLKTVVAAKNKITSVDREILKDYEIEFEYDMYGTLKNAAPLFKEGFKNIFSNNSYDSQANRTVSSSTPP